MLNIGVLVSGGGTNLQALLDAEKKGILHSGHIALAVSSKEGVYALTRAENAGIETAVLLKENTGGIPETPDAYGKRLVALLREKQIDLVVLAGFMLILAPCVIEAFPERIVNVHPSLIPSFCGEGFYGLKVHEAALAKGVKVTGATVHLVNEIPDGGRILAQKAVDVLPEDTPQTLQKRVMEQAEWLLLPRETERLAAELNRGGKQEAL